MASSEVLEEIQEFRKKLWTPPDNLPPADWCSRHVYLDQRQTEQSGYVQFHTRKFMVEVINCMADRNVNEVTLCSGGQIGKSVGQMCSLAWTCNNDPGPSLVILPTRALCLAYVKDRWKPLIELCEPFQSEIPSDRHRITTLAQNFNSCVVAWVGANSATNLSSRGVRYLFLDEVDKFPAESRREASAVSLAEVRVRSYTFSKIFRTSTPTLTSGPIWQEFLKGSQEYFWLPCPKCGQFQVLIWQQVKWDSFYTQDGSHDFPKILPTARYECIHCQHRIGDKDKLGMLAKGEWRPKNPAAPRGRRSFHLSSLYAIGSKTTFAALTEKFLTDKASIDGLRGFINSILALPWIGDDTTLHRSEIISPPDAPPLEESIKLMTVDCQLTARPFLFWIVVREWDPKGHSRLVGAFGAQDWESVRRLQLHFQITDNRVLVDSGWNSATAYGQCLSHGVLVQRNATFPLHVGWIPFKGRDSEGHWVSPDGKRKSPYFYSTAAVDPRLHVHLPLLEAVGDVFLDALAKLRKGPEKAGGMNWEVCALPASVDVPGIACVDAEVYFQHLDSMKKKPFAKARTGKIVWKWVPVSDHRANHLLDCEWMGLCWAACHKRFSLQVPVREEAAAPAEAQEPQPAP